MLDLICKMYVEKQIEESKQKGNDEDYYMGYMQALYDSLVKNGYNHAQIDKTIKKYQKELELSYI